MTDLGNDNAANDPLDTSDGPTFVDLEARLTQALTTRADALAIDEAPFDPTRATTTSPSQLSPAAVGHRDVDRTSANSAKVALNRRTRFVWIAAVAAAAILTAVFVLPRASNNPEVFTGRGPGAGTVPGATEAPPGPGAPVLPSWAPDGLHVWSVFTGYTHVDSADIPLFPGTTQLLTSTTDDAAMLVTITPHSTGMDGGPPIAVRGVTGHVTGENLPIERRSLRWAEQGIDINVALRSVADDRAVTVLNALVLRDPSKPEAGFLAPSEPTWELRGDHVAAANPNTLNRVFVTLEYDRTVPDGSTTPELTVTTYAGGEHVPGYLTTAFEGSIRPDGLAVATQSTSYAMVWPDGRMVQIVLGGPIDTAIAERIALSAQPVSPNQLTDLRHEVNDRFAQGSVLASVELASGRVELIGTGTPTAICLRDHTGQRECRPRHWWPSLKNCCPTVGSPPFLASVSIGPTWYVFAASQNEVSMSSVSPDHGQVQNGTDGPWTLTLLAAPDATNEVDVMIDGNYLGVSRPLPS